MTYLKLIPRIPLRMKLLVLVMVPLLSMFAVIVAVLSIQSKKLSESQAEVIRSETLASKRQELKQYMELAMASIEPIYREAESDDLAAQEKVKQRLRNLTFGEDGYFFAHRYDGTSLVLPYQSDIIGTNILEIEDQKGFKLLRALIDAAKDGGGFVQYVWHKPSRNLPVTKLSYAVGLDKWQWMIGTGIYIEDIDKRVNTVHGKIEETIESTFISLALALIIMIGIVVFVSTTLNVNAREMADRKLHKLNKQIISSQEQEKARVARELHDGINQILVSVKYRFDSLLEAQSAEEKSKHILLGQATLNQAVTEVRRISKDLRPALLDHLGLLAALEDLAGEVSLRSGIRVLFEHQIDINKVSASAQTTLFRVAQEALHNVEKHSQAVAVDMILQEEEHEVVLTIADDGIGFEEYRLTEPTGSMGLRNMRERIENLDGTFSINSLLNRGTEVRAVLPVEESAYL
ncbi:cache domain-containing protein [Veronia pacifica]|uniref:histidine kinase n=1 Tax=Veronia pacifica TaxID=1080227 RepID=A0A1C3E9G6_9GAMM|nr:cache domain-containing protein [Veronia pacifica]ODA29918.1 histidine kinase [Veronia pacifica]